MLPVDYFAQNHILPGSHITVPRDESPMRNSAIQLPDDDPEPGESSSKQIKAAYFTSAEGAPYGMGDNRYSEELANGDSADNRDIHEDEDMNDDVVDYQGQTNAGYGSVLPTTYFAGNTIKEGSHIQVPRDDRPMRNSLLQVDNDPAGESSHKKITASYFTSAEGGTYGSGSLNYSEELANGDSADNRDIHEDEDMNDDVVDVNGQTNAGYSSVLPTTYFAGNNIIAGSHIQVPRNDAPMRNSALQLTSLI